MIYVARKISKAKWELKPEFISELSKEAIPADAITADLRTQRNRLSLWKFEDESALEEVVLALATRMQRLDKIDIVWTEFELLISKGLKYEETEGETPVRNLKDRHIDLINLDVKRLEEIAIILADSIRNNKPPKVKRFAKNKVREILQQGLREERFSPDNLSENLRRDLRLG